MLDDVEWDLGKVHSWMLPGFGMFPEAAGPCRGGWAKGASRGGGGGIITSNRDRKGMNSLLQPDLSARDAMINLVGRLGKHNTWDKSLACHWLYTLI